MGDVTAHGTWVGQTHSDSDSESDSNSDSDI